MIFIFNIILTSFNTPPKGLKYIALPVSWSSKNIHCPGRRFSGIGLGSSESPCENQGVNKLRTKNDDSHGKIHDSKFKQRVQQVVVVFTHTGMPMGHWDMIWTSWKWCIFMSFLKHMWGYLKWYKMSSPVDAQNESYTQNTWGRYCRCNRKLEAAVVGRAC